MPAKNIMIVEDESIIALDIKTSLLRLGYDVSGVAASGDIALRKIAEKQPDLILMDIHLKGEMSGIEVSERVKSDFQIPVLYLTANADNSTFQKAKHTDPYGYILKPFGEKELGIAIEIALHKHQQEQVIRSSESWYATAFQSLDEAIIATAPDGLVVFMNAFAESITGRLLMDATDKPITDLLTLQRKIQQFDQIDLPTSVNSILAAVLRGRTALSLPHNAQLIRDSLPNVSIEGSATAIRDAAGNVNGSIFVFRPVKATPAVATAVSTQPLSTQAQGQSSTLVSEKPITNKSASTPKDQAPIDQAPTDQASTDSALEQAEDLDLIKAFTQAFIQQQPVLLATPRLSASSGGRATTLTAKAEGIVINVMPVKDKLTAIVRQNSAYSELIRHVLIENSFFPVSYRTNGTCYYQHRAIPEQCQIYYTRAEALWEAWHGKIVGDSQSKGLLPQAKPRRENIIVLRRGSWYHIQQLMLNNEGMRIKTVGGEIFITPEDSLVWGIQAQNTRLLDESVAT